MSLVRNVAINGPDKNFAVNATEKRSPLELYLIRKRPSGQITSEQLTEYTQAQRDMINQMKVIRSLVVSYSRTKKKIILCAISFFIFILVDFQCIET